MGESPQGGEFNPDFDGRELSMLAMAIFDDDIAKGRTNDEAEEPYDETLQNVEFPTVKEEKINELKNWQESPIIATIKDYVKSDKPSPSKLEAMALPVEVRHYLNHKSLFRMNNGILYRIWVEKDGKINPLIVLSEIALHDMLKRIHAENHAGFRATFKMISDRYYAFHMRKTVQLHVASCPTCTLNNHPKCNADKSGNMMTNLPNEVVVIDFLGPLNNHKT